MAKRTDTKRRTTITRRKKPPIIRDEIIRIVKNSINEMTTDYSIAHTIEKEQNRKAGSMHLAVKMCIWKLIDEGIVGRLPPKDQHDSATIFLREKYAK